MSNLQQVKKIVKAKWNKSNGNGSNFSQEELTAEAEKILKKTQSKWNFLLPEEIIESKGDIDLASWPFC